MLKSPIARKILLVEREPFDGLNLMAEFGKQTRTKQIPAEYSAELVHDVLRAIATFCVRRGLGEWKD